MEHVFPSEISTTPLGDSDFDVLYTELAMADVLIRQEIYAAVMKGYALALIISYMTEEEYASLKNVLDSVAFD